MKNYYRLMLGKKSMHAQECFTGAFIGINDDTGDLAGRLSDDWRSFNREFIPILQKAFPEKSKIALGLACGFVWTVSKGILNGDVVLCPDGSGRYRLCEVIGDYVYSPGNTLGHRRPVKWLDQMIDRADMSEALKNSTSSACTICNITRYAEEIEKLIGGCVSPGPVAADASIEDPAAFAMEEHLEEFLVKNWSQTELGKDYDIFEEDGAPVGQQYATDTGPLDILAVSKDKTKLLVIELKKGRASDAVVGQILRYMGYAKEVLAESGQSVHGIIIALEDDQRIRRALAMVPNITFYRYQVSFRLVKT